MSLALSKLQALLETIFPKLDEDTRVRAGLSFFNANPRERKRRLEWVMRLTVEYQRVLATDRFGTGLMLADLEKVVDGDFIRLKRDLVYWTYDDDEAMRDRYGTLHAPWKGMIEEYVLESESNMGGLGEA